MTDWSTETGQPDLTDERVGWLLSERCTLHPSKRVQAYTDVVVAEGTSGYWAVQQKTSLHE